MTAQVKAPPPAARRQGKAVQRRTRMAVPTSTTAPRAAHRAPVLARVRYRFDNALARGPMVVILYLSALSVTVMFVAALIAAVARLRFGGSNEAGFVEDLWQTMLRTLDAGSFAADAGWAERLLGLVVTVIGIFLAGSLIGLIANAVDQRVDDLRRGHGAVLEAGHTLILGWSPHVPRIISELVIANESERAATVVVMARGDKTAMEETLRELVPDRKTTRVVCRSGNPAQPDDLRRVALTDARSVIIVRDEDGDAGVLKAVLSVRAVEPDFGGAHIVAEIADQDYVRTLRAVTDGAVLTVSPDEVVAEVATQACLRGGLAAVFADLLDFDGCELYFTPATPVTGRPYRDALLAYDASAVVGRITAGGLIELNPPVETVLDGSDQLIVIAEDDSTIAFSGIADVPVPEIEAATAVAEPVNVLVIGWSRFGTKLLRELDEFLPAGSTVEVRLDADLADPAEARSYSMSSATLTVRADGRGPEALLALAEGPRPHQVVVLGYRDALGVDDADSLTLLTLLALRSMWPGRTGDAEHVRVVAEMLDQRHLVLADPVGVDDLIVSDALTSQLMAQLSERGELHGVFEELFDVGGSSIEMLPASSLVPSTSLPFAGVVAAGAALGASVIGYRLHATGTVVINPRKSATVTLAEGDQVIVIADRTALRAARD